MSAGARPLLGDALVASMADDALAGALEVLLEVDPDYRAPAPVVRRLLEQVAEAERAAGPDAADTLASAHADRNAAEADATRAEDALVAVAGELVQVVRTLERAVGTDRSTVLLEGTMSSRITRALPLRAQDVLAVVRAHMDAGGPHGCTCA